MSSAISNTSVKRPIVQTDASEPINEQSIKIHLKEIPFFTEIPDSKLIELANLFEFRRVGENELIFKQGDNADFFAIIVYGLIDVSAQGPGGELVHLNQLVDGDWFGEIALTQNTVRTATLRAIKQCLILYLPSEKFHTFLQQAPEIHQSNLINSTITKRTANSLKSIPLFNFLARRTNRPSIPSINSSVNRPPNMPVNQPMNPQSNSRFAPQRDAQFDESKLNLLGELFRFQQFARHEVVFKEGDEADAFYIIQRGTVGVYARKGANDEKDVVQTGEILRNQSNHLTGHSSHDYLGASSDSDDCSSFDDSGSDRGDHSPRRSSSSPGSPSHPRVPRSHARRSSTSKYGVMLTELTKNDWFGEIALVSHTRRTATVLTRTPCIMLKLLKDDFERFLTIVPEVRAAFQRVMSVRIAQTLSNIPFFRAVKENRPWAKIGVLGAMFVFEHYRAGEIVVCESEETDKFMLICDGSVQASKRLGADEQPIVLEQLGKNQWFGENSLIQAKPALSTITCLEDTLFLSITRAKFQRLIEIAPEIVDDFSALMTFRTASMLANIEFFASNIREGDRPWSKRELLCSMFSYEYANSGDTIFKQGEMTEDTNKFYIIQRGSVVCEASNQSASQSTHHTSESFENNPSANNQSIDQPVNQSNNPLESMQDMSLASENQSINQQSTDPSIHQSITRSTPPVKPTLPRQSSLPRLSIRITPSADRPSIPPPIDYTIPVTLRAGSYFGELALLRSCPRPCTVTAREPCVLLTLTREKFHQFAKVAPEVRTGLAARFPAFTDVTPPDPVSPLRIDEDENRQNNEYNIFVQRVKEDQAYQQAATQIYNQSINQTNNQSNNQTINQSNNQSINQSINPSHKTNIPTDSEDSKRRLSESTSDVSVKFHEDIE